MATKKIEWKPIIFENTDDTAKMWWSYKGKKLFIPHYYGIRIDWENKQYTFDKVEEYPTINDMIANGEDIKCCFPYEECNSIEYKSRKINLRRVVDFFKRKGYNVTIDAIEHNYNAWLNDYKSGYRDEVNGYHLFTPCGCNPLQFRLTTLHPTASEWQITYEC